MLYFFFQSLDYLAGAFGVPFKVDFVSEAKCQERVFDAAAPACYALLKQQSHYSCTREEKNK